MKILIVGPAWVGDMIMAQTLLIALKKQRPDAVIHVLAPMWTHALLARMPEVDEAIVLPLTHGELKLLTRYRIGKTLRQQQYNEAIILPNSLKSALIPWFARIPKRTGFRREGRQWLLSDVRVLDKKKYPRMIDRFLALAQAKDTPLKSPDPRPCFTVDLATQQASIRTFDLCLEKPVIALCPGAEFGPAKRWPAAYYAKVAEAMQKTGKQVWLFGSNNDAAIVNEIMILTPHCINLCGKTSLAQAIDLLSLASLVVSNDSGLLHLAAALDRPVVAIYGPTSPDFTPPLTDKAAIIKQTLPCQPCFQRECPLKHWRCMLELTADRVIEKMNALLDSYLPHTNSPSSRS